jgi:DNA-directed RNA polymerase subunit RPC12/RpoP
MRGEIQMDYYCLSCKKNFESDEKGIVSCKFCGEELYVRKSEKKTQKLLSTKYQELNRKYDMLSERYKRIRFYLKFEHYLTSSMKKYIPTKKEFDECLELAKKESIKRNKNLYEHLKNKRMLGKLFEQDD